MDVRSEMMGSVWKVLAREGEDVVAGQTLMILESMKMEIQIDSPVSGVVVSIGVVEGQVIEDGQLLAQVE